MWFLQIKILAVLLACSLALGILLRLTEGRRRFRSVLLRLIPLADIGVILYVSEKLAVFYVGYLLVTFVFLLLLRKHRKGWLFALLCAACVVPLAYSRAAAQWTQLPMYGLTMVGIAYNMLKAIDALYYTYYTDERIGFFDYASYLLFFPVITAGPVFRYRDFSTQLRTLSGIDIDGLVYGVKRIIAGLFSKMVLSAAAAELLKILTYREPRIWISLAIPIVSYLVLFFDMAGYASVAIGLSAFMGIKAPENFKAPWKAASFTQFWRNWHITVSDWIREHVYVVFSKKRLNRWQNAGLALVVMVVMSLWHGSSVLFVVDGVLLGLLLALENLLGLTTVKRKANRFYRFFRCVVVNYLFALNTMLFTLSWPQIVQVFGGFLKI